MWSNRRRRGVVAAVSSLAVMAVVASSADAATMLATRIVTNPMSSDSTAVVRCMLSNVGPKPITVQTAGIFSIVDGSALSLQDNECSGRDVGSGQTCQLATDFGIQSGRGVFVLKGSAKSVRAMCQAVTVQGGAQTVHSEAEAR